jgi:ankyrin repeat protein
MIQKTPFFNKQPYTPPFNRFDDRPMSKQIYKNDNSNINISMVSVITSANPTEILNFFTQNPYTSYLDKDGNTPVHLITLIDENKLNQRQKIDIIKQLIQPPLNISIDSINNNSESPLHIAIKKQFSKLVKFFIKNGANTNKINYLHQNSLHIAMIPNIKLCERPTKPDQIVQLETSTEDKNVLYNNILSVFYNNSPKLDPIIKFINYNVDQILINDGFYDQYKRSLIELKSDIEVFEKNTLIDNAFQDILNEIYKNLTNSKITELEIKKNISYCIVNALGKMTKAVEKFINNGINEISMEERNGLIIGNFEPNKILDQLTMFKVSGSINSGLNNKLSADDYIDSRKKIIEGKIIKDLKKIEEILNANRYAIVSDFISNNNQLYYTLITVPSSIVVGNIITYYTLITTGGTRFTILPFGTDKEKKVITELNKILPQHITNLNLWLALENMKTNKIILPLIIDPVNPVNYDKYNGNSVYKPLDYFLIVKNPSNPPNPPIILHTIDKVQPKQHVNPPVNPPINPVNISQMMIPNSYNTQTKDFDFFDLLKKQIFQYIFNNINETIIPVVVGAPALPFDNIWDQVLEIVKQHFSGLNTITENNIKTETMFIIAQVIDRILINNIKSRIYLNCIEKLKKIILEDIDPKFNNQQGPPVINGFKDKISSFLDKLIAQTNVSLKLDKNINEMVQFNPSNPPNPQIDNYYNISNLIDEYNITKIFDYGITIKRDGKPNQEKLDDLDRIYGKDDKGDYLVYYNNDYNSINPLTTRQCMFNSTSIILELFSNNSSPDIYKVDANGYTPIFYAIKSGNYLLIETLIQLIQPTSSTRPNYSIQYQLNKYNESPIYAAFKEFKLKLTDVKPDFPMINVTFMNNLLLSAQISNNIPKDYYNLYQKMVYWLNDLINKMLEGSFSLFADLLKFDITTLRSTPPQQQIFTDNYYDIKIDKNKKEIELINSLLNSKQLDAIDKIVNDINALIIGKKSINTIMIQLANLKKSIKFDKKLDKLKDLVNIFEQRHKPNRLYNYNKDKMFRPNPITSDDIDNVNKYFLILISIGIISIIDIFKTYYLNIILKLFYTTNIFNFTSNFTSTQKNKVIEDQIEAIIKDFIKQNIFTFVRTFYFIKLDQYDNLSSNISIMDEYMTKLLELLIQNGLVAPDSEIEKNIKQYINPHIGELVIKTLEYNQVLIDIVNRYIFNLYHSMKTFDNLTKDI